MSDIVIFVLKMDLKLQLTQLTIIIIIIITGTRDNYLSDVL